MTQQQKQISIGAGAVIDAMGGDAELESDIARMALRLFRGARDDLRSALAESDAMQNVLPSGNIVVGMKPGDHIVEN